MRESRKIGEYDYWCWLPYRAIAICLYHHHHPANQPPRRVSIIHLSPLHYTILSYLPLPLPLSISIYITYRVWKANMEWNSYVISFIQATPAITITAVLYHYIPPFINYFTNTQHTNRTIYLSPFWLPLSPLPLITTRYHNPILPILD